MSITRNHLEAQTLKATPLTRNQVRGFWASWGGWTLDGMDSFIYALVLVPSLRELLPRSGIAATKGNIGYYGGLLFALFLCGWGLAFLWGPVGDKFGRVRTLMLTIVWYSVFTFLGALLNYWIGSRYGWRIMFFVGGLPALLLAWVRHGVTEPQRWRQKVGVVRSWQIWKPLAILFSSGMRRRTILNSLYMLASICGLWAGTVYVPAAVTVLAEAAGSVGPSAAQLASRAAMLVSFATSLGCLATHWRAEKLGRRGA